MSYQDLTDNKNPNENYRNYLGNHEEPEDRYENDTLNPSDLELQMNPQTMRDEFRRLARNLRGEL